MILTSFTIAVFVARGFATFDLNMFLNFIPMPPPPEGPARQFTAALFMSHYIYVMGALQVVGGLFLSSERWITVGSNAVGTCNCEYCLLPPPDGTCRVADGVCGFVPGPVPTLALTRGFRGAREKAQCRHSRNCPAKQLRRETQPLSPD